MTDSVSAQEQPHTAPVEPLAAPVAAAPTEAGAPPQRTGGSRRGGRNRNRGAVTVFGIDRRGSLVAGVLLAARNHDLGALFGHRLRGRLADAARARLDTAGLGSNVRIEAVDALAWETDRRFDVICVTGAVATLPPRFLQWLRPGGRLFVVRGASPVMEGVLHIDDVNGARIESLFETDLPYLVGAAPAPQFVF